jgi:hypothetical protein
MRNPWDFWKGMLCADIFIYLVYMFFGLFQYSTKASTPTTPPSKVSTHTTTNTCWKHPCIRRHPIVGGLIAAALYGNIGIKVIYNNVFMELIPYVTPPLFCP